ncbi:AarF/UbiB family protein [Neobacillus sp. GCM10023253]|uniref:AarF/UbiB family protein n=1 Tax=Neobacillus sp. GCM10023253 TaxID=3252644 RepID=UPI0036204269
MDDYHKITVEKTGLKINNPTRYELIGKGVQGAVFRISEDRCVKVYARERHCLKESEALNLGQHSAIVPKVFDVGAKYIVMEYIKGQSMKDYLQPLAIIPDPIAKQLVFIFKEMKRMGFTRIDASIRHLIVNEQGEVKVIDHVNSLKTRHLWPMDFFKALGKLKLLDTFLYQLKEMDPDLYCEWKAMMDTGVN